MHQDNSPDVASSAIRRALRAISVGSYVFQCEVASRLGLNPTDLQAIHRLGLTPDGLTAGALARQLGLTSGATTTAIDRLARMGYVSRRTDPGDRRRVNVRLEPLAARRLGGEYEQIDRRVDAAIGELEPDELAVVARFLDRIASPRAANRADGDPPAS